MSCNPDASFQKALVGGWRILFRFQGPSFLPSTRHLEPTFGDSFFPKGPSGCHGDVREKNLSKGLEI